MKKIIFLLLLVSHTIFSQQIGTFNDPKDYYQVAISDFQINPTLHAFLTNQKDLDLKKGKPIKNISCYYYDNTAKTYYIEFTPDGKITRNEDFYRNQKIIFNYSKEIITRQHYEIRNDKSERLCSIDSIVYDHYDNIIRKSSTNYDLKQKIYEVQVNDYEYLEKNKLAKMYQYSIVENMPYLAGNLSIYEYKMSIITEKKYHFENNNHSSKKFKKDSITINPNFSKNVYYLNKKGEISKFDHFYTDKSIDKSTNLKYDDFSKITSITSTHFDEPDTQTFKFDITNNLTELTYDGAIRKCKYDKNNNLISDILTDKETNQNIFVIQQKYQYDINNNWTSIVIFKNGSFDTKMTRKINYY